MCHKYIKYLLKIKFRQNFQEKKIIKENIRKFDQFLTKTDKIDINSKKIQ